MNDIDGLVIRVGHGVAGKDIKAEEHIKKAIKYQIPFGIYLFADGKNSQLEIERLIEWQDYIDNNIKQCDAVCCCLAYDYEINAGRDYVKEAVNAIKSGIKSRRIKRPVLWYDGMNHYKNSQDYSPTLKESIESVCDLWIARYNVVPPNCFCTMWQHSSNIMYMGANGFFDESYIGESAFSHIFERN